MAIAAAALVASLAVSYRLVVKAADDPMRTDFGSFYYSAQRWRVGESLYARAVDSTIRWNQNPPHWTALMLLLSPLSAGAAFLLWTVVGLTSLLGTLWMFREELERWTRTEFVVGAAIACWLQPWFHAIGEGQVVFVLMWVLAAAWRAESDGRPVVSGLLLGVVISVKPFLAPLLGWPLVRRSWRTIAAALVGGAGAVSVGIGIFGLGPYAEWIDQLRTISRVNHPANLSLLAWWLRTPIASVTLPAVGTIAGVVIISAVALRSRRLSHAHAAGLLLAGALLLSPLGWSYYAWLAMPLVVVSRPWTSAPRSTALVLGLLFLPTVDPVGGVAVWHPLRYLTTGSWLTYAGAVAWFSLARAGLVPQRLGPAPTSVDR